MRGCFISGDPQISLEEQAAPNAISKALGESPWRALLAREFMDQAASKRKFVTDLTRIVRVDPDIAKASSPSVKWRLLSAVRIFTLIICPPAHGDFKKNFDMN